MARLAKLRDPAAFEAWSYRLLVRACYAESRRARRWLPNLAGGTAREHPVEGGVAVVVDRDQLERGFRRLSMDQRAVVVLRHYPDMPLKRVAHTLGIPEGTARAVTGETPNWPWRSAQVAPDGTLWTLDPNELVGDNSSTLVSFGDGAWTVRHESVAAFDLERGGTVWVGTGSRISGLRDAPRHRSPGVRMPRRSGTVL